MKSKTLRHTTLAILASFCFSLMLLSERPTMAQGNGNSISGIIFGVDRQPLNDIVVELLDEFSRSQSRIRSSGGGRYSFYNVRNGRFTIRVMPFGTDYEEQIQEGEIVNLISRDSAGNIRVNGYENILKDIYLEPRRIKTDKGYVSVIFVQDVPEKAKKAFQKALAAIENKSDSEALLALQSAVEIFPDYYAALEQLGLYYVRSKEYDKAAPILSHAVQINPRGYKSWYSLAATQFALKQFAEATEAAKKAVDLDARSMDALFLYGISLKSMKNFQEAETILIKAKVLSRNTMPDVHWHLALMYFNNLGRFTEAADELELFLKAQKDSRDEVKIKELIKICREKAQQQKKS